MNTARCNLAPLHGGHDWVALNGETWRCPGAARAVAGGEPPAHAFTIAGKPSACAVPGCRFCADPSLNEAAGGEPSDECSASSRRIIEDAAATRPSEREWLEAVYDMDDTEGIERLAPLIDRTEAAARREVVAAVEALERPCSPSGGCAFCRQDDAFADGIRYAARTARAARSAGDAK